MLHHAGSWLFPSHLDRQADRLPRHPGKRPSVSHSFRVTCFNSSTLQDPDDSCTPEQLAALDTTASDLRTQTATLLATVKTLRATLASLNSTLSTADLIANVTALETEKAEVVARLENLTAGKAKKVTKRERDEADREWEKWGRASRKRSKISQEVWHTVEDHLPEGDAEMKAEVRENLGLDE